ncbi:arsenical pump-driving ATPase [Methylacidimicrobium sp. B4]|uniref:arsenical pump-driving ATPase n=1 Tax=Methylacidimicrobium sp. B4 TaxID=2796139 RepID=UPI001A8EEC92|nr:arsenical pump-driving ATPase [Methylacidimicrobium sp. B4]QSR85226.1 arsenical pump-driving ATPase [Methylacidimicrobium sp. B4]
MRFLEDPPRFLFFTGKGGVGKTSLACASAVYLAEEGKRVLLVSTDPASNVGQVFSFSIGHRIAAVPAVAHLSALEIDPQEAARAYRERIVGPVRGHLPEPVVRGIEEQLSGACTTEIAAFDEFTVLLTDSERTAGFDHVLFDTAPTGHTIRLLQLPSAWSGFLEAGKGGVSCLGPMAGLGRQRNQYKAAVEALADPGRTRLVLVTRAQEAALREVARTREELAAIGLRQQHLVVNGIFPSDEAQEDRLAASIRRREQDALRRMPEALRALPREEIPLQPFNLVGLDPLRRLLKGKGPRVELLEATELVRPSSPALSALLEGIAADGRGLVMFLGKGGVGKTTLAAAFAVELARRGFPVHLTTSDPAAHLTETLGDASSRLMVSRIDPREEAERYRKEVLEAKGTHLDAAGRALLEEDLRSPCTEEVAVFQAFSRILQEAEEKFVILDTAPTGHTLLLLDATGAYHREVIRQKEKRGTSCTTPLMRLQDPRQTKVLIVTLAETTPVLEAAGLQADLRRAGIEPWAWIVNSSVAAANPRSPLLRQRAQSEWREIDAVAAVHAKRFALVPLLEREPVGIAPLRELIDRSDPRAAG